MLWLPLRELELLRELLWLREELWEDEREAEFFCLFLAVIPLISSSAIS